MNRFSLTPSRHLLTALMVAVFGLAAGVTCADSHKPVPAHEKHKPAGDAPQHGMAGELNLNDKQRELFKTAMQQKMGGMHTGMDMHENLRELTQSDNYDEKKVRELVRKNNQEEEERIVKSSKSMNEFYKSLSPEQKSKLKEMHKNRNAKMKGQMNEKMSGHRQMKGQMQEGGDEKDAE